MAGAHLGHLVQKQRPPVGHLEEPLLQRHRPREGPLLVAEELALQELILKAAAVDGKERPAGPRALLVDGLRHQPLAGPALPLDEHVGVGGGDPLHDREHGGHRRALAQDKRGRAVPLGTPCGAGPCSLA